MQKFLNVYSRNQTYFSISRYGFPCILLLPILNLTLAVSFSSVLHTMQTLPIRNSQKLSSSGKEDVSQVMTALIERTLGKQSLKT